MTRKRGHQRRFGVNVWAGILGNKLIGPHILPNRLRGAEYLQFLQEDLPNLLNEVPIGMRRGMWYQHDGAPPNFSITVREYLDTQFPNRWIGRGGPVSWPPRSPDLNPLDYYLWGHVKDLVYATPIEHEAELMPRITAAFDSVRNEPEVLERVMENMNKRVILCLYERGQHFEQVLRHKR